jgi:carbon monoxide dehydrogenase subunit G
MSTHLMIWRRFEMKLEQSFEVSAPVDQVWKALIDIERVAPCLPGASITGRNDDGTYSGAFTIKIGPTTAAYTGKLEMQNVDESAHTATMQAQGSDRRGQGGANATINSKLTEVDSGTTRVEVDTDYHITGRLARFGRGGMIEDISERLLREFARRLQESLAGQPAEAAPEPATAVHAVEPEAPTEPEAAVEPAPEAEATEPEAAEPEPEAAEPEPEAAEREPEAAEPEAAEPEAAEPEPPAAEPAPEPEPEAAAPPPPPPPPPAPEPPKPPPIEPAEPLDAGSLVGSVVWERVQRNPAPFVGALAFVLTILLLRRRRRD